MSDAAERVASARKNPERTVLAHISDLHFRGTTDPASGVWRALVDDLKSHDVDAVIVSGDVVDRSFRDALMFRSKAAFTRARDYLVGLAIELAIDPVEALIVVPGNHDVRLKGFLIGHERGLFFATFQPYFGARTLGHLGLTIHTFDSNHVRSPFELATGHVDPNALIGFADPVEHGPYTRSTRPPLKIDIAVLHHHPMPIAATERGGSITDVEQMLLLKNAGQFMTEMVKARVDLVLHGHKHWPAFSRATFRAEGAEHTIAVLAAGSVARSDPPTYNLVVIHRSGAIEVERRVLNGVGFDREIRFDVETYETARARKFERLARNAGALIRVERYSRVDRIQPGSGDDDIEELFDKVVAFGTESVSEIVSSYQATYGYIARRHYEPELPQRITWFRGDLVRPGVRRAKSVFDPPITPDRPISYFRRGRYANAVYFSRKDRREASRSVSDTEAVGSATQHLYESMALSVVFPEGHFPSEFWLEVYTARQRQRIYVEEHYLRHRLTVVPASRTVALSFEKPLPMYEYRIVWSLPEEDPTDVRLNETQKAFANALTRKIRGVDPPVLTEVLGSLTQEISTFTGSGDIAADFFRYDAAAGGLVLTASSAPGPHPVDVIPNGRGPVGRSFRRRSVVCCVPAASQELLWDPADEVEPLPATTAAFAVIPLAYPLNDGRKIGVVVIRTSDEVSPLNEVRVNPNLLLDLFESTQRWFSTRMARAIGIAAFPQTLFCRPDEILPDRSRVLDETELSEATSSFKMLFIA